MRPEPLAESRPALRAPLAETLFPTSHRSWAAFAAAQVPILIVTGTIAYYEIFSYFADYDDEGCLMLLVRHFLDGNRLYDDVWTIYGPLYFLYKWLIHAGIGLPLTHDVVRLHATAFRLATAVLSSGVVFCMTRRVWLAVVTQVLVAAHLSTVVNEPGHPQEMAAALVTIVILLGAAAWTGKTWRGRVALGLGVAAVAMVKLNLGVLTAVGVWLALLSTTRATKTSVLVRVFSAAAVIVLPWILMWAHLGQTWGLGFARLMSMAIVSVAVVSLADRNGTLDVGALLAFAVAGMTGVVLIYTAILLKGTSVGSLIEWQLIVPGRWVGTFIIVPVLYPWAPAVGTVAVLLSLVYAWRGWRRLHDHRAAAAAVAVAKLAFGAAALVKSWQQEMFFLLNGLTPFIWLVLLARGPQDRFDRLPRLVLAWTAVLLPLQAYPVAGSQRFFGTVLHVVCAAVCIADVLAWVHSVLPVAARPAVRAAGAAAALIALAIAAHGRLSVVRERYARCVPLGLPGAQRLRVPAAKAAVLRSLVNVLRRDSDTFLAYPGFNSLYFWTGEQPPTLDVLSQEITILPEAKREALVEALVSRSRPIVILHPELWPPYRPFIERLMRDFTPRFNIGKYRVLFGRERTPGSPRE